MGRQVPWRKPLAVLAVALLTLLPLVQPARAATTTVVFSDFSDLSDFELSGSTAANANPRLTGDGHVIRMTTGLWQAGGAFLRDPIPLEDASGFKASFSTAFRFRITNPVGCVDTDGVRGADGLVFVVQTNSNQYGGAGGGIGYQNIPKSVGVEFDTWNNGGWDDNNGNHVGINTNGNINSVVQTHVSEGYMNDGAAWHAWVDYDGDTKQLEVRLSKSSSRPAAALLSHTIDLVSVLGQPNAFVGFTSGTGCAGGDHDILSWEFRNTYNPVGSCPDGFTWRAPLAGSSVHSLSNGTSLNIGFQWCASSQFVRDESVIILVQDKATGEPVTAWVYGSDVIIDETAMEYRQTFHSGDYGLTNGQQLEVHVYLSDALVGVAEVQVVP